MVDLDELERCGTDEEREDPMICVVCNDEVHDINCGLGGDMYEAPMLCCECMHGTIQKLCAELRAARECARILLLVTETDALRNEDEDMHGEAVWALDKLAQATKGDG